MTMLAMQRGGRFAPPSLEKGHTRSVMAVPGPETEPPENPSPTILDRVRPLSVNAIVSRAQESKL